jgi:glycosyltransferase involved in cell wall biosynthesis
VVATLKGTPFIVTWHEVWNREYWTDYLGWAGWLAWAGEFLAMRLPDHIIAASAQTADRLSGTLGSRKLITTVSSGIDLDLIKSVTAHPVPSDIIVVGRLIEHKRVDMLLDVIADLRAQGTYLTCRVVGYGPARPALSEQAHRRGLHSAIDFLDRVDDPKELYSLLKAAKVFVSLSAREGFGIAVLEAIACGVPVLTTSAPDNLSQHLVKQYSRGVVCAPKPAEISRSLLELLHDEDGPRDEASTDSWVVAYDWESLAELMVDVYGT